MNTHSPPVWLPIATSPRTRHARLVYCPERKNIYLVAWQPTEDTFDYADGHWTQFGSGGLLREAPTHWMPLPPGPEKA